MNLHGDFLLYVSNMHLLTYPICELFLSCATIIVIRLLFIDDVYKSVSHFVQENANYLFFC